jgi:galactokinase
MNELQNLISQNVIHFEKEFGTFPSLTASAPGRINTIGEHTDYNEGLSLATGINRWVLVSMKARQDDMVFVKSGNYDSSISFKLGELLDEKEKWHRILSGAVAMLKKKHTLDHGFDAYIWGNVPLGSGVSSSAAIEVALLNAIRTLYQLPINDTQLVLFCQQIEHHYMGVKSGLLDQYTSQFSSEKALILLDFKSISHEHVPVNLQGYQWVLVNTMVKRELSGSKYSERVEETQLAFSILKEKFPSINHFRDVQLSHLEVLEEGNLKNRMIHYVEENARVHTFVKALQELNFKEAGDCLNASHLSLKNNYEVSCEELDFLAEKALKIEGCLGSRMMGGGFGGCTINLVKENALYNFCQKISELYKAAYRIEPEINIYNTVDGATVELHLLNSSEKK